MRVLILLYILLYVTSYYCVFVCPHTTICVLVLVYACLHATLYVSSYYSACVGMQAMQCRQHLQDVLLPVVARCRKAVERVSGGGGSRSGGAEARALRLLAASNISGAREGARENGRREEEGWECLPSSISAAALALQDVCRGDWQVDMRV
jgi:hypothetical protein